MKSNPVLPGGLLKSKPMWLNTFGCSATSAFFVVLLLHEPPRCSLRDSPRRHHSLSIQAEEEMSYESFQDFVYNLARPGRVRSRRNGQCPGSRQRDKSGQSPETRV